MQGVHRQNKLQREPASCLGTIRPRGRRTPANHPAYQKLNSNQRTAQAVFRAVDLARRKVKH